jgi:N-acetyl-beta-hexosaminidase
MLRGPLRDGEDIDHKDGNRLNNKPSNLRICNDQINSQNRKKRSDNTSGTTGVTRYTNNQGREYWIARWTDIKGKESAKSFRIDVWGDEEAYRIAIKFREMKIESLKAQGLFYTERHGK